MVDLLIDLTRRYNITLFFFKELAIFEKYMKEKKILDKEQIQEKIKRISYEIYEESFDDKSILICGIEENGSIIAKKIIKELQSICDIKIEFMSIDLNKRKPLNTVKIKPKPFIITFIRNSINFSHFEFSNKILVCSCRKINIRYFNIICVIAYYIHYNKN